MPALVVANYLGVPHRRYPDLMAQLLVHGGALYGVYLIFTSCHLVTPLWGEWWFSFGGAGPRISSGDMSVRLI